MAEFELGDSALVYNIVDDAYTPGTVVLLQGGWAAVERDTIPQGNCPWLVCKTEGLRVPDAPLPGPVPLKVGDCVCRRTDMDQTPGDILIISGDFAWVLFDPLVGPETVCLADLVLAP